ncbi:MAG: isoprenylcysteine carboxylmethyltransferase family protein [Desulfobacterales bacterium]|nr:isoprenylcysteine carboxylmethyltransferase family protein [Desulfobacterales bacterium]
MKKIIHFPPFYFFSIVALNIVCPFLFPEFNDIPFPYNLSGLIGSMFGLFILMKSSNLFHEKKTTFRLEKPTALVQNDFYKISRNPMYLGALIFIFGESVLMGNRISFICPILFFLFINFLCIPPEEMMMEKTFGRKYAEYKKNVRRWL